MSSLVSGKTSRPMTSDALATTMICRVLIRRRAARVHQARATKTSPRPSRCQPQATYLAMHHTAIASPPTMISTAAGSRERRAGAPRHLPVTSHRRPQGHESPAAGAPLLDDDQVESTGQLLDRLQTHTRPRCGDAEVWLVGQHQLERLVAVRVGIDL